MSSIVESTRELLTGVECPSPVDDDVGESEIVPVDLVSIVWLWFTDCEVYSVPGIDVALRSVVPVIRSSVEMPFVSESVGDMVGGSLARSESVVAISLTTVLAAGCRAQE